MKHFQHAEGLLSRDEAIEFLEKKLEISDAKDLLTNNPVALLDRIAHHITEAVPFQNLTMMSAPVGTLHVPDMTKIKTELMAGRGALHHGNNMFLCELLDALDFKAYLVHATVVNPDDHCVVIVTAMPSGETGGSYLLDNGIPLAYGEAVPLNFEGESPVCDLGHSVYKLRRDGDTYTRFTAKRGNTYVTSTEFKNPDIVFEWKRTLSFNTKPFNIAEFAKVMEFPYTKYFGTLGNFIFSVTRGDVVHIIEDFDKSTAELSLKHHVIKPCGHVESRLENVEDFIACIKKITTVYNDDELRGAMKNLVHYKRSFNEKNGIREKTNPENGFPI